MRQYLNLLQHILENGSEKTDRTGTGTKAVFGYQMRFDLSKGFPMLTTKKLHLKSIVRHVGEFGSAVFGRHFQSVAGFVNCRTLGCHSLRKEDAEQGNGKLKVDRA